MPAVLERMERIPMSVQEFERLPEGPPYYDYIDGEAIKLNKPTGRHQRIQMRLANDLFLHTSATGSGEIYHDIDVQLPAGNWVGPDIVFIAAEHMDRYNEEKGDLYGAPDLAVEILSPSNSDYDRIDKYDQYQKAEVPWLWFVDQVTLAIEEYQWTLDGYLRTGGAHGGEAFMPKLFPNHTIDIKALTGF